MRLGTAVAASRHRLFVIGHAGGQPERAVRQSQRAGRLAHGRDRHHGRPGLRLRALQGIRFPGAEGGGADVRRRAAGRHTPRRSSRRSPHHCTKADVLLRRQDGGWPARDPARCRQGADTPSARTPGRIIEIEQAARTRPTWKAEIEKGISAVQPRRRRADRALLPLSEPEGHQGARSLICRAATSRSSRTDIDSFDFKLRKPDARSSRSVMAKLEKKGKGIVLMHDIQPAHRQGRAGPARCAQGGRLQGRAHAAEVRAEDDRRVRRQVEKDVRGHGRRHGPADVERDPHRRGCCARAIRGRTRLPAKK